ncbi:hypothetical protein BDK51DRAFT_29639 [Blyttiomyces helicus]|uniref:Uncharacterized protein n=1 Tax=Blyttiomyces helicus TaxID=388810 RepID=A0A4P9WQJ6_9FUNG|nr:hypothetical protein BDK51DRAFT_29639 [Blyttiomyces helicus]|eukprot:RKO94665.1 hypothetical protein BDK51DRAFT_29639 [Blyttiomyces helicus]
MINFQTVRIKEQVADDWSQRSVEMLFVVRAFYDKHLDIKRDQILALPHPNNNNLDPLHANPHFPFKLATFLNLLHPLGVNLHYVGTSSLIKYISLSVVPPPSLRPQKLAKRMYGDKSVEGGDDGWKVAVGRDEITGTIIGAMGDVEAKTLIIVVPATEGLLFGMELTSQPSKKTRKWVMGKRKKIQTETSGLEGEFNDVLWSQLSGSSALFANGEAILCNQFFGEDIVDATGVGKLNEVESHVDREFVDIHDGIVDSVGKMRNVGVERLCKFLSKDGIAYLYIIDELAGLRIDG